MCVCVCIYIYNYICSFNLVILKLRPDRMSPLSYFAH